MRHILCFREHGHLGCLQMGVFSMEAGGMRAVEDLSAQFLASRSSSSVSSALTVTMDSARPLAMEVQVRSCWQVTQVQLLAGNTGTAAGG